MQCVILEIPLIKPRVTHLVIYQGSCAVCGDVCSSHRLQTSTATYAASVLLGPLARALASSLRQQ
jgi:hypothetical protein